MDGGIIEVFARCVTCGVSGTMAQRVVRYAKDVGAMVSLNKTGKLNTEAMNKIHLDYLKKAGMSPDYTPIVVYNGGERIVRLDQWKP